MLDKVFMWAWVILAAITIAEEGRDGVIDAVMCLIIAGLHWRLAYTRT